MIITTDFEDLIFSGMSHKFTKTYLESLSEDEQILANNTIIKYLRKHQGYYNVQLDRMFENGQLVTMNKVMKYDIKNKPFALMEQTLFLNMKLEVDPMIQVPDVRSKTHVVLPNMYTWIHSITTFIINQMVIRRRDYMLGDIRRILCSIVLKWKDKNEKEPKHITLLTYFSKMCKETEGEICDKLETWLKRSILDYIENLREDCTKLTLDAYKGDPKGIYPIYLTPLLDKGKLNLLGLVRPKKK